MQTSWYQAIIHLPIHKIQAGETFQKESKA
jgi:hypothetical protein